MNVRELAEKYRDVIVAWRREFHENPELTGEEIRTGNRVQEELEKMGIEVRRMARTGVLGILKGKTPGKTVALRADMDALPVTEANEIPYKSKNPGVMHACGHDGHVAMLLGAAKILSQMKDELKGTVKFIFQPAEESAWGAKNMLEEGAMEGVTGILGIHLWADLPCGKVSLEAGPRMASTDIFKIFVKGKSGHGSMPHQGIDAIVAASAIVLNLQSIVSRETSPLEPAVVSIGKFNGGARWNVLCNEVVMEGTTRCFNTEIQENFPGMIERIAKNTAEAYRAEAEVEYTVGTPVLINDADMSRLAAGAITKLYGLNALVEMEKVMGGEDFAFLSRTAPGVMAFVGAGNKAKGACYPHHHEKFNIDEDALPIGTSLYAQFAVDFLNR
ncbi:putative hydrolase YxeP [Koleobacter methoxysyntrophicus]|uniref:Putative hydrolase YxeP n=1 Tax=Koleobacter methoxysyntrophicus TaxID=2751313 RepID=A0A8A0RPT3_9FIRM|nr:M20 family metallopeptidase [Koleobacter methoxysyntrophicus]QSQ09216.1 putative hydrolase YxeP [Koleobacter methoxysyntrophicus]